jgi:hemerythrin-like domain-containing protein
MDLDERELSRRGALAAAALLGSGVLVSAGGLLLPAQAQTKKGKHGKTVGQAKGDNGGEEGGQKVSATEDLMREHGVLRRTLIVYAETAGMLRKDAGKLDASALADAARVFRSFGENYHERILEEQYVFPEVRQAGGPAGSLVDVLLRQHQRGREITDYIEHIGNSGSLGANNAEPLARALESMVRMYNAHATWEDTVVFQAWKKGQSESRLDDLAEKFEQIEQQQFGKDGFDDALQRIGKVEQVLGLADLNHYTASAPPAG